MGNGHEPGYLLKKQRKKIIQSSLEQKSKTLKSIGKESEGEIEREPHVMIFFFPKDGLPSGNFWIVESPDHPPSVALAPHFALHGLAVFRDN